MSTRSSRKGQLRYPLSSILGSEAQVQLIRVLVTETDSPLSVADAARLAGLTHAGASRALERLEQAGFARRVGSGHPKYAVRPDAVALSAITHAFEQERQHYDGFSHDLRSAVSLPEVTAAWLEPLPEVLSEPIHVTVVVEAKALVWAGEELRSRLIDIERQFNVIIEVSIHTRADTPEAGPQVELLWGMQPSAGASIRAGLQSHDEVMARSLRMSRVIADLIRQDPTLVKRATRHVARLINEDQGLANKDLAEWRQLLETYSAERLGDLIASRTSRGDRLRQSSPFFAVLTEAERNHLVAELETKG